jgi:hypothetical protein
VWFKADLVFCIELWPAMAGIGRRSAGEIKAHQS